MASRSRQICIRVSDDDDVFVREMDGSWSDILRIGFEKWASEYPDFLMKKQQEYKELYTKCITKQGIVYTKSIQQSGDLLSIYKTYVSTGRSVESPTSQDRSWVKARLGSLSNGSRVSVQQWFVFAQKQWRLDHQSKLKVDE